MGRELLIRINTIVPAIRYQLIEVDMIENQIMTQIVILNKLKKKQLISLTHAIIKMSLALQDLMGESLARLRRGIVLHLKIDQNLRLSKLLLMVVKILLG